MGGKRKEEPTRQRVEPPQSPGGERDSAQRGPCGCPRASRLSQEMLTAGELERFTQQAQPSQGSPQALGDAEGQSPPRLGGETCPVSTGGRGGGRGGGAADARQAAGDVEMEEAGAPPADAVVDYAGTLTAVLGDGVYELDGVTLLLTAHMHPRALGRGLRAGAAVRLVHVVPVLLGGELHGFACGTFRRASRPAPTSAGLLLPLRCAVDRPTAGLAMDLTTTFSSKSRRLPDARL